MPYRAFSSSKIWTQSRPSNEKPSDCGPETALEIVACAKGGRQAPAGFTVHCVAMRKERPAIAVMAADEPQHQHRIASPREIPKHRGEADRQSFVPPMRRQTRPLPRVSRQAPFTGFGQHLMRIGTVRIAAGEIGLISRIGLAQIMQIAGKRNVAVQARGRPGPVREIFGPIAHVLAVIEQRQGARGKRAELVAFGRRRRREMLLLGCGSAGRRGIEPPWRNQDHTPRPAFVVEAVGEHALQLPSAAAF